MPDTPRPDPLELGLYARDTPEPRITDIEVIAIVLTGIWLCVAVALAIWGRGTGGGGVTGLLAVLMPVALIWVAATAARTMRSLREEAMRLQASIDAMRAAYADQRDRDGADLKPAVVRKLDELVAARGGDTEAGHPTFSSLRAGARQEDRAAMGLPPAAPGPEVPQPSLALATPLARDPISVTDFIKALDFPKDEHDKDGFRTLRRALLDPSTERLIRASQDVLTLLSQDGIYMDDLVPERARPEIWRKFAQGERGRAIGVVGGIHDRSSLVLAAGRMKKDPVFRDAVHHFLRHFDRTFMEFERNASDTEIVQLANTRTSRAFMLLGRATGTFD